MRELQLSPRLLTDIEAILRRARRRVNVHRPGDVCVRVLRMALPGTRQAPPACLSESIAEQVPDISELDLNSIFALPPGQGCRIVDARMRVEAPNKRLASRSHPRRIPVWRDSHSLHPFGVHHDSSDTCPILLRRPPWGTMPTSSIPVYRLWW